ncbi:unnamed protein product [Caenorhabditis angaria]|uniref:Uncharacterized protein n=1 Tax=Caenorhabditis angaria TaxID=860376 RepID=A0A9P1N0J7_9PELO|nr:unnamed protein product [Caenorhabditis angaria]
MSSQSSSPTEATNTEPNGQVWLSLVPNQKCHKIEDKLRGFDVRKKPGTEYCELHFRKFDDYSKFMSANPTLAPTLNHKLQFMNINQHVGKDIMMANLNEKWKIKSIEKKIGKTEAIVEFESHLDVANALKFFNQQAVFGFGSAHFQTKVIPYFEENHETTVVAGDYKMVIADENNKPLMKYAQTAEKLKNSHETRKRSQEEELFDMLDLEKRKCVDEEEIECFIKDVGSIMSKVKERNKENSAKIESKWQKLKSVMKKKEEDPATPDSP